MKKETLQKIIISFFVMIIILCVLVVWIFVKGNITQIKNDHVSIQGQVGKELLKGEKITGAITGSNSNMGIILVRFTNFNKINSDSVLFSIRPANSTWWIYSHTYKVDQFLPNEFFTFGIPVQSNSWGKKYYFEIQSMNGQRGDAIGLSTIKPSAEIVYSFPKKYLLSHPLAIGEVVLTKLGDMFSYAPFAFLTLLIYLFILVTIFTGMHLRSLSKNKNFFYVLYQQIRRKPLFYIIFFGMIFRLFLATGPYNGDTAAFMNASTFLQQHFFNVYAHTNAYNYSPVIFFVFCLLAAIKNTLHIFSWPYLWRVFLSLFDLATLFVLIEIAKVKKIHPIRTSILFFLNPVSIIVSGYHGQFENVAIFFLLLAVLLHYKTVENKKQKIFLKWAYLTISLLIKHIIVFQLLVFWQNDVKKKSKIIMFFAFSLLVFLASFIPFWFGAKTQIIHNVFLYGGVPGDYGITYFLIKWLPGVTLHGLYLTSLYKYIFILFLFGLPFFLKGKDVARNMLFMFIFFTTFTSGIGIQYFVLPIAFGALFPSKWFYLYSIVVGLGYIGGLEQFIPITTPAFSFISFNTIWIFSTFWFASELFYLSKPLQMIYHKYIPTS